MLMGTLDNSTNADLVVSVHCIASATTSVIQVRFVATLAEVHHQPEI